MTAEPGTRDRLDALAPTLAPLDPPLGWRVWWFAVRTRTLSLSVVPVLVGAALAWRETGGLTWLATLAALAGAVFIQIGTNLYNDVADFERGGDRPERIGPPRVTAQGWAPPDRVRQAAYLAFALAAAVGLYLIVVGGWPILGLGVASILAGLAYSGGPKPIAATPLGEAMVILFFGLGAVGGTSYLTAKTLSGSALLLGAAIGLLAAAVLHVNNCRDREPDRQAGRRTLAILASPFQGKLLYAAFVLAPLPLLLALPALIEGRPMDWGAMAFFLLYPIPAGQAIHGFWRAAPGPAFNALLGRTARLQVLLGGLAILSLVP